MYLALLYRSNAANMAVWVFMRANSDVGRFSRMSSYLRQVRVSTRAVLPHISQNMSYPLLSLLSLLSVYIFRLSLKSAIVANLWHHDFRWLNLVVVDEASLQPPLLSDPCTQLLTWVDFFLKTYRSACCMFQCPVGIVRCLQYKYSKQ